jgi:hypothetical protein
MAHTLNIQRAHSRWIQMMAFQGTSPSLFTHHLSACFKASTILPICTDLDDP